MLGTLAGKAAHLPQPAQPGLVHTCSDTVPPARAGAAHRGPQLLREQPGPAGDPLGGDGDAVGNERAARQPAQAPRKAAGLPTPPAAAPALPEGRPGPARGVYAPPAGAAAGEGLGGRARPAGGAPQGFHEGAAGSCLDFKSDQASDLARELLADLLHDAARHPVPGFEPQRCRRLARALRTEGAAAPAVQAATATALQLARIDGPHRWAWMFWADKTVSSEFRRWQARHLVESWTAGSEAARPA